MFAFESAAYKRVLRAVSLTILGVAILAASGVANAESIAPFLGSYQGAATVDTEDGMEQRDMSVEIAEAKKGFRVKWSSAIAKPDGRTKTATYEIEFIESDRDNVYASAMQTNVFGHEVPLDPMQGEPYVWARLVGDTLTVFSLHVDAEGGYEMQEYNRTLADGGLELDYQRIRNGEQLKAIRTFLEKM